MFNLAIPFDIDSNNQDNKFEKITFAFLNGEELEDKILRFKHVRSSSVETYKASLKVFKSFLKKRNLKLISEDDVISFEIYLSKQNISTYTSISYLYAVKSFFDILFNRGLYPNVAFDIRTPKKPKGLMRDALTRDQAKQLLESVKGDDIIAKRDRAILNVLLRCGLRSIEVERSNIEDLRFQKGTPVLFVQGKGRDSKDEFVVLTKKTSEVIQEYLSLRKETRAREPLFVSHGNRSDKDKSGRLQTRSIRRIVKTYLRRIGLNNSRLTCHSLRHTFATLALENNASLVSVQKAMRHKSINSTTAYVDAAYRLKNSAENFIDL